MSVCLSHAGIVSKRLNVSLNCFDHQAALSFWFFRPLASIPNSKANPFSDGVKYTGVGKKLAIFD